MILFALDLPTGSRVEMARREQVLAGEERLDLFLQDHECDL
jgi:hypothetical protein